MTSPSATQQIDAIAQRHGFSPEAVRAMLDAVAAGHGGMAQFSHPEFGGSGQWMRGGMTMIGDLFDAGLKARVVALCDELAGLLPAELGGPTPFQSQTQDSGPHQVTDAASGGLGRQMGGTGRNWWPGDLGQPSSTGGQDGVRYAYFADARRLAVDEGGRVAIYDTGDHRIGGVSQQ